jgi:hypothetical protein
VSRCNSQIDVYAAFAEAASAKWHFLQVDATFLGISAGV